MAQHDIIKSLGEKVSRLIADNEKLRGERDGLIAGNDRLKAGERELKQNIAALEKRIKVLELGSSISGGSVDTKQAKARINQLMREIDKCLTLMNR